MVFDALAHLTEDGRWFHTNLDASEHELLRQLDESETQRAMVVGLPGYIENRFVLEVCHRNPSRLVPCASFNPVAHSDGKDAAAAARAELQNSEYRGVKFHPRLNHYDPLDPRFLAVLEEMASWKQPLPVWLCTLFYYRGGQLRKSPVDTIHELVGRFPSLTFVLAHGGGSWMIQVAEAVRDCSNAFLDISLTMQKYRSSSIAADLHCLFDIFDRRMLFGSDFPEAGLASSLKMFQEIASGISPEKCANVLGENLNRILKM